MNHLFPLGFPGPTAFYLTLFVLTLALHVAFMNYVLVGTAWLAGAALTRRLRSPISMLLRDWMPFALSGAITAGVAPLLFVQILYQTPFYTANLLLFHRWMIILPVLIIAFYLLYLLKSKKILKRFAYLSGPACIGAALCVLFVALSWTENHLLSLRPQSEWAAMYAEGRMTAPAPEAWPRLATFAVGGIPVFAAMAAWQFWGLRRRALRAGAVTIHAGPRPITIDDRAIDAALRTLALTAVAAIPVAAGFAWLYASRLAPGEADAITGPLAGPYLVIAAAGALAQLVGWITVVRRRRAIAPILALITIGASLTVTAMAVAREALRLHRIDITAYTAEHADAAAVGGLTVFLAFAVINIALIALCIRLVRRGGKPITA